MKTNILYYILFAIMLVMTVSGQESDSSDALDMEDFDLELEEVEPDDADVRYLLGATNVEKALRREIQRSHDDYHHVDIAGVDGIEVFCPEHAMSRGRSNRNIKRLETELRRFANKRRNRRNRNRYGDRWNRNRNGDYHLIRLFSCQIYCPDDICPN